jgi:hydrogenase/urease accessory protein HupE
VVASAIDWILVFVAFLIVSIPLGMIETLGRTIGGLPGDALVYLVDALALGVVVALRWRERTPLVAAVGALAAWTIGVWIVLVAGIVAADHALGFTVVHAVLAVVSIVLAAVAWRETCRRAASPGGGRPDGSVDPVGAT